MLRWALIFLVIALVAALFGFYGYCRCGRRDCQILVLPVPGGLPDLFCYRHIGRQEGSVSGVMIPARL